MCGDVESTQDIDFGTVSVSPTIDIYEYTGYDKNKHKTSKCYNVVTALYGCMLDCSIWHMRVGNWYNVIWSAGNCFFWS